jgi:peptide/nickel transport system ATP-binding protein
VSSLRFDNVTVRYGSGRNAFTAVQRASLTVPSGQVVGLVGESGSGKSTLARAAVGLADITSGSVTVNDIDLHRRRGLEQPLQMVFQDPSASLDPRMKIGASIVEAMPSETRRSREARLREMSRLLELVHLESGTADLRPGELSGGQRQRVAFARALAGRPEVIIADEITSALDVSVQGAILNLVRELQRDLNLTLLFISHNLAVIRYVSDYIAVMYMGEIVEAGPAADILSTPMHPYTRDLLAAAPTAAPLLPLQRRSEPSDRVAVADPPDPHAPPSGCRYHPRCPIGPLINADRKICVTVDPSADSADRPQQVACHFATALAAEGNVRG